MSEELAWDFCFEKLAQVSRSFALPISFLDEKTKNPVALSYLLCRMVDCIEDAPYLPHSQRDALYEAFRRFLRGDEDGSLFKKERIAFASLSPAEQDLMTNAATVGQAWNSLSADARMVLRPWIQEMAFGMQIFNHRTPKAGFRALENLNDLHRYCYYVAGTVGHLLTEFFAFAYGFDAQRKNELKANAESFALGLQLTNILKDVAEDHARGMIFIPKTNWRRQNLDPSNLLYAENRPAAHEAIRPIFEMAEDALAGGLDYLTNLPVQHASARLFCGIPLLMAVATLAEAKNNDAQFEKELKVKISRNFTANIVTHCRANIADNAALVRAFERLKNKKTLP